MEDILKAAVHALSKERNNGVRGIAQQQHAAAVRPGVGAHRAQKSVGVLQHLVYGTLCTANQGKRLGNKK